MSNPLTIEPTEFVNVRNRQEKTFGVRVYDNYDQSYDNTWDLIPDDDMEILEKVIANNNEQMQAMLDYVKENECGISIGGEWYDWDEIKVVFS